MMRGMRIRWRRTLSVAALSAVTLATLLGVLGAAAERGGPPSARAAGCNMFPPFRGGPHAAQAGNETAWNQNISHTPRSRRSGRYIHRILRLNTSQTIQPGFGRWRVPYAVVGRHRRKVRVKVSPWRRESDFGLAPIPSHAPMSANSDRHVVVLQQGTCRLYEMYGASYLGGKGQRWHAASTARFNLHSAKRRRDRWTSANAAGLPILPGVIRYGEVKKGRIRHAIAVTFAATRRAYIHPATHFASSSCDPGLPPMGLRLRLSHDYFAHNLHRFRRGSQSRAIFVALYRYGLITSDNGGNWGITTDRSKRWRDAQLNRLKSIPGQAFVAVKAGRIHTPC